MTTSTAAQPLFDREGDHWHMHGTAVVPLDHRGRPSKAGCTVGVHSQFKQRFHARPVVVATAADTTATITLRMAPKDARLLAQALLLGADAADAVAAAMALTSTTDQPRRLAA